MLQVHVTGPAIWMKRSRVGTVIAMIWLKVLVKCQYVWNLPKKNQSSAETDLDNVAIQVPLCESCSRQVKYSAESKV